MARWQESPYQRSRTSPSPRPWSRRSRRRSMGSSPTARSPPMSIASTPRRVSALALAAALTLPATASAMPTDTVHPAPPLVREATGGDGPALAISLAGGGLALLVAGGGYVALRGPRVRPVHRVHVKT